MSSKATMDNKRLLNLPRAFVSATTSSTAAGAVAEAMQPSMTAISILTWRAIRLRLTNKAVMTAALIDIQKTFRL